MEKNYPKKCPELLAPVGSEQALAAAIEAGADAVYLGATQFSARAFAHNFDRAALGLAVKTAHSAGVKVYLALNTLITDRQMMQALELAAYAYEVGVDALIVADLGLASLLRAQYPDFPLHASTQCSGHSTAGARKLAELGFERMVAARELSSEAIARLVKDSPIPIEIFVHGALCVSASGQCLFSSIVGGRSGNRGECAQPCRMNYNNRTPLSLKDLSLAAHIPELIDMGVASLKIEGRMKSPTYVYTVVSIFRRLLDEHRAATPKEMAQLESVFSREGFTDGYYTGKLSSMNGVRREADKEASRTAAQKANRRQSSSAFTLEADSQGGDIIRKVGTPLQSIELERPKHAPPVLPALPAKPTSAEWKPLKTARFYRPETIPDRHDFDVIFLPLERFDPKKANGVLLPPIIWDRDEAKIAEMLEKAKANGASHVMVTGIGQLELAKASGLSLHGDWRLNIENSYSAALWSELDELILTPELIIPQMRDIPARKSAIVYGRIPLMLLEKSCGAPQLIDRRKAAFPIVKEGGRELVLNSVPTYMADRKTDLERLGLCAEHFIFTVEGAQEVRYILDCYQKGLPTKKEIRRMK